MISRAARGGLGIVVMRKAVVDEVELAGEPARQIAHVGLEEGAVVEPVGKGGTVRCVHHPGGEVAPDHLAVRHQARDPFELLSGTAACVENPAVLEPSHGG